MDEQNNRLATDEINNFAVAGVAVTQGGEGTTQVSETLALMIQEIVKVSNVADIGPDTRLGDINLDSLKFIELLLGFIKFYPGDVDLDQLTVDAETTLRMIDDRLLGKTTVQ